MATQDENDELNLELTTSLRWRTISTDTNDAEHSYGKDCQLDSIPLHYHRDRLLSAAKAFRWPLAITALTEDDSLSVLRFKLLAFSVSLTQHETYKLRLTLSPTGVISISASSPITSSLFSFSLPSPSSLNNKTTNPSTRAELYLAPTSITPSKYTKHKTTNRQPYNTLLQLLPSSFTSLPPTTVEILLYNSANQITECVYSTPYFLRNNHLITPSASCGGNMGVTRRLALEKGWCEEGVIAKESLREGEIVVLSNAVRGFWAARLSLSLPDEREVATPRGKGEKEPRR